MANSKLPTKNVMVILLFGGGILLFVLLTIFPNYIAYSNIGHEIKMLKNQIEEQKILSPIFSDLSAKAVFQDPKNLPFPKREKLQQNETSNISKIIQNIIRLNNYTLDKIFTDVGGLSQNPGILKMNIEMTGSFLNLRNMILQLGALPYLEHIEYIRINNHNDNKKILMKFWIAQAQ